MYNFSVYVGVGVMIINIKIMYIKIGWSFRIGTTTRIFFFFQITISTPDYEYQSRNFIRRFKI